MDYRILLVVAFAGIFAIAMSWWSVQSLFQARLLSGWRRPSLDGLHGRAVALYGEVRVRDPLRIRQVVECLWHREVITVSAGKPSRTESDISQMAGFTLVFQEREFRVADLPTEVHGGESATGRDWGLSAMLDGGTRTIK